MICTAGWAQIDIDRQILLKLPPELSYGLLGMRVNLDKVVIMNNLGRMISLDLSTGESFNNRIKGERVLDFDLVLGQPLILNEEGQLSGQIDQNWPKNGWNACRIEHCDQGLLITGGDKMVFLAANATEAVEISNVHFALPFTEGFIWSVSLSQKIGPWVINLYDCFGNRMKEIYRFSPEFDPAGLELGPLGIEGEALISSYENNQRKIALIGQNGHMIWKIDGPEKVCQRDLGFDSTGNLLVLEKSGNDIVLSRWKFAAPQG
ncbi:MAG: hypothetical protein ACOYXC_16510 [Candidatus Rifleibacteriota bacterium]